MYEIVHRDKQLKKEGKNYSLGKILIDWYNEHQDKETGLWDKGVNYDATNALLKIVGTYDTFGTLFPNADLAKKDYRQKGFYLSILEIGSKAQDIALC